MLVAKGAVLDEIVPMKKCLYCSSWLILVAACAPSITITRAVETGDLDAVRSWLGRDPALVNKPAKLGTTPLIRAIVTQHNDIVRLLIERGADVNSKNRIGQPALGVALSVDNLEAAELLLAAKADPNLTGQMGFLPLHHAAQRGHLKMVKRFLSLGQEINTPSKDGWTPLHLTVGRITDKEKNLPMARLLLRRGAKVNLQDRFGQTPLVLACPANADPAMLQSLLAAGADPNIPKQEGRTALHEATARKFLGQLKVLLASGADVNQVDDSGKTPLFEAVYEDQEEIFRLLLDKGARVDIRDKEGNTILHAAVARGAIKCLTLALARQAPTRVDNRKGWDPLEVAMRKPHEQCARLLYAARKRELAAQGIPISNMPPSLSLRGAYVRIATSDAFGRLKSLRVRIPIAVFDLENQPLTVTWTTTSGTISGNPVEGLWQPARAPGGGYLPARVTVKIDDGHGASSRISWDLK